MTALLSFCRKKGPLHISLQNGSVTQVMNVHFFGKSWLL